MYGVLIAIDTPEKAWCRTLASDARWSVEVTGFVPWGSGRVTETVRITGRALDDALEVIHRDPNVDDVEVVGRDEDRVELRLAVAPCPLADLVQCTGLAPQLPFQVENGQDMWLVLGQRERLHRAMRRLEDGGRGFHVVRSGQWVPRHHGLTEHQLRVMEAAIAAGFYDYPRRITLTRLADRIGVSKSTLSETLILVESKVVRRFREGWMEGAAPSRFEPHATVKNGDK